MKFEGEDVIFEGEDVIFESTGRSTYAYSRDFMPDNNNNVCYGYDGGFSITNDRERKEIYDYMIDRWRKWLKRELSDKP